LKQPSPQLVDNCTCGTIPFPLYREFPGLAIYIKIKVFLNKKTSTANLSSIQKLEKKHANTKGMALISLAMLSILPLFLVVKQIDPLKMNQFPNYYKYF
jgi:hypothetical protein